MTGPRAPEFEPEDRARTWAIATAAGKDATLALHRSRAAGLRVPLAFTIVEGNTDRVRFHGTRHELVRAHAEALGLRLVVGRTHPDDFEVVYRRLLDDLVARGIDGLVYGNIHLADVQEWYERMTRAAGLLHREPLWGGDPRGLVREFLAAGYRATVVGVDLGRGDGSWPGVELGEELVQEMERRRIDPCGEYGEYHTFVWDGPGFRSPVSFERGPMLEREGHRFVDLRPH